MSFDGRLNSATSWRWVTIRRRPAELALELGVVHQPEHLHASDGASARTSSAATPLPVITQLGVRRSSASSLDGLDDLGEPLRCGPGSP